MNTTNRRYDIDWMRVIAIGLLLIFHIAIGFQSWGIMIGFITNPQSWDSLWIPMAMLNIWRIPLLFFVSGMGVYFALRQRTWKELLLERTQRILVPFLFGVFVIVPVHLIIWQKYYGLELTYTYDPGHLWFLGNIFVYVLLLTPVFFYFKTNEEGSVVRVIKRVLGHPAALAVIVFPFVVEAWLADPHPYELYAKTWHGFFLGLLAFFFGFCFVLTGDPFWQMIRRWRWAFVVMALTMFVIRLFMFQLQAPVYLLPVESDFWILSVLSFGSMYLNRPGKALGYLSQAAYPIYIVHMIFIYLGSSLIFPLDLPAPVKLILLVGFTFAGCLGSYELLIRRIIFMRPLFGLRTGR